MRCTVSVYSSVRVRRPGIVEFEQFCFPCHLADLTVLLTASVYTRDLKHLLHCLYSIYLYRS